MTKIDIKNDHFKMLGTKELEVSHQIGKNQESAQTRIDPTFFKKFNFLQRCWNALIKTFESIGLIDNYSWTKVSVEDGETTKAYYVYKKAFPDLDFKTIPSQSEQIGSHPRQYGSGISRSRQREKASKSPYDSSRSTSPSDSSRPTSPLLTKRKDSSDSLRSTSPVDYSSETQTDPVLGISKEQVNAATHFEDIRKLLTIAIKCRSDTKEEKFIEILNQTGKSIKTDPNLKESYSLLTDLRSDYRKAPIPFLGISIRDIERADSLSLARHILCQIASVIDAASEQDMKTGIYNLFEQLAENEKFDAETSHGVYYLEKILDKYDSFLPKPLPKKTVVLPHLNVSQEQITAAETKSQCKKLLCEIFNLPLSCDDKTLKGAYFQKMKAFHPDRTQFLEPSEAKKYSVATQALTDLMSKYNS